VQELNDKIKAHNRRVDKVQAKTKLIKKDILMGKMSKEIGGMAGTLAKDIATKDKTLKMERKRAALAAESEARAKQVHSQKATYNSKKAAPKQPAKQQMVSAPLNQQSTISLQAKQPVLGASNSKQKLEADDELIRQEMNWHQNDEFEGGEDEEIKQPDNQNSS